jgi:formylglycine-generating enzyme required for sulfatase activity
MPAFGSHAKSRREGVFRGRPENEARPTLADMVELTGGQFLMGSERYYAEEAPVREATVAPFFIDRTPVTNREFAAFAAETGYITSAERNPGASDDPTVKPGALNFRPRKDVNGTLASWWEFREGASWRRPQNERSVFAGRMDHPVTCVTYEDAENYARWCGKRLPTEAEWEYAARGGLEGAEFSWGNDFDPAGQQMANIWAGPFAAGIKGHKHGTTRVGSYPANGYGLFDMIGNVWEWTSSWFLWPPTNGGCCTALQDRDAAPDESFDPDLPSVRIPRRVVKGGSFLCSPDYCARYRPAARQPQMIDTATVHIGFRCVQSA